MIRLTDIFEGLLGSIHTEWKRTRKRIFSLISSDSFLAFFAFTFPFARCERSLIRYVGFGFVNTIDEVLKYSQKIFAFEHFGFCRNDHDFSVVWGKMLANLGNLSWACKKNSRGFHKYTKLTILASEEGRKEKKSVSNSYL